MKRVELGIAALLGVSALGSVAFVIAYVEGADTQALGLSLARRSASSPPP